MKTLKKSLSTFLLFDSFRVGMELKPERNLESAKQEESLKEAFSRKKMFTNTGKVKLIILEKRLTGWGLATRISIAQINRESRVEFTKANFFKRANFM